MPHPVNAGKTMDEEFRGAVSFNSSNTLHCCPTSLRLCANVTAAVPKMLKEMERYEITVGHIRLSLLSKNGPERNTGVVAHT